MCISMTFRRDPGCVCVLLSICWIRECTLGPLKSIPRFPRFWLSMGSRLVDAFGLLAQSTDIQEEESNWRNSLVRRRKLSARESTHVLESNKPSPKFCTSGMRCDGESTACLLRQFSIRFSQVQRSRQRPNGRTNSSNNML